MSFLTACYYLAPILAALAVIAAASSLACRTLTYREQRDTRHDAEDAEDAETWPLPAPDASDEEFEAWGRQALDIANPPAFSPTPIYADLAAEVLRGELDDADAVGRWLA